MKNSPLITVQVTVKSDIMRAWDAFTNPQAVTQWNFASPDWHCPRAENDLRNGGQFNYRMEARDGSHGFDFIGQYIEVKRLERIRYMLGPEREVTVEFRSVEGGTEVSETFTPESIHPLELQRSGWQAILDNYKQYAEGAQ